MNGRQNKKKSLHKTAFLSPKVIESIIQSANKLKKDGAFIDVDLCEGFSSEDVSAEEFKLLVQDLRTFFPNSFRIVIYTNPHAPKATKDWADANAELIAELRQNKQFLYDEEYQKQDHRNESKKDWDKLWDTPELESRKSIWAEDSAQGFLSRGNNSTQYTLQQAKQIVIDETIDVFSSAPHKDSNDNRLHIILSTKPLFKIMNESITKENLEKGNRKPNSIQPVKIKKLENQNKKAKTEYENKAEISTSSSSGEEDNHHEQAAVNEKSASIPVPSIDSNNNNKSSNSPPRSSLQSSTAMLQKQLTENQVDQDKQITINETFNPEPWQVFSLQMAITSGNADFYVKVAKQLFSPTPDNDQKEEVAALPSLKSEIAYPNPKLSRSYESSLDYPKDYARSSFIQYGGKKQPPFTQSTVSADEKLTFVPVQH